MSKILIVILSIFFRSITFGQSLMPGQFTTIRPVDSSFYFQSTLTLKCDNTFIFADSSIIGFGKWQVKKNELLLHLDSINKPELGINLIGSKITLRIKDYKLFAKVIQKKPYNKIPALYMKTYGKIPKLESYSSFKNNNKDNYYIRISTTSCN